MIGQTVSHYRVEERLGGDGMGEVYRNHDSKLNRDVTIRSLTEYLQHNPTAHQLFLREAQSAAALDHPFICGIFEVDKTENVQDFIVKEYVRGQTLSRNSHRNPCACGRAYRSPPK
jgi:serine/threonine protein kinase